MMKYIGKNNKKEQVFVNPEHVAAVIAPANGAAPTLVVLNSGQKIVIEDKGWGEIATALGGWSS